MALSTTYDMTLCDWTTGVTFRVEVSGPWSDRIVTVYDMRFPDKFGAVGQKVSYLPAGTIFRRAYQGFGWAMFMDIPSWHLSAGSIRRIADWLIETDAF